MDNNFIIDFLNKYMPHPRKNVRGGYNVNCPVCIHNGEARPDTKFRCGLRNYGDGSIAINCFNCSFATRWRPGMRLTKNLRFFASVCGAGDLEIKQINYQAWLLAQQYEESNEQPVFFYSPDFDVVELPRNSKSFTRLLNEQCTDQNFIDVASYVLSRSPTLYDGYDFYWCNSDWKGMNRRLIIPFFYKGKIVGYTGRAIDSDVQPRYHNNSQHHLLVNNRVLYLDREYVILTEGVLDALAIDGVSTQGAKLSDEQASWLRSSGKTIIILPDRDKAGQTLINLAIKHKFNVSFPPWDDDIKDADDAVRRYGKSWTVYSIISNRTDNPMKINMMRKR